ncbi:helix-turn-helix domain-containing protein [Psychrosphaera ytuae]|uniref:Helix-turn-helix domain-containing protein n=1 Tax=Psychrosphaera ytuae TaxID=2820710 RepID=A0A975DA05_9GAMM|nr:helix-turn-helix domain-containing protein [Psychrosphaera ytuae]
MDKVLNHLELYIEDERLMRKPDIQKLLNISRSTLGRWVKTGKFPQPTFIQNQRSYWQFKHVNAWLQSKNF